MTLSPIVLTILVVIALVAVLFLITTLVLAIITTIWPSPEIYATVPGETNLIYLKSTKSVQVRMSINDESESIIPFAPAYGYGGTYVYFLPGENKLVNENGVEVPGISRKVGDRPRAITSD